MGLTRRVVKNFYKLGGLDAISRLWKNSLTVLAYHRICEHDRDDFSFFKPNVSAAPEMFHRQMKYVAERYNVISLYDLDAFLAGKSTLPERPLLITFDDGYRDNYDHAAPILQSFGFPAVIFIVTSRMQEGSQPLWWDLCAHYFHHSSGSEVTLPLLGKRILGNNKLAVCMEMIETLKKLPEAERLEILAKIPASLAVDSVIPDTNLFMSWAEVKQLAEQNILCQPHTVTHPIMSRITKAEAFTQLAQAKQEIEQIAGYPAIAFAYPNGMPGDYDASTIQTLRETGYRLSFTLSPGPMRLSEVRRHPHQIRRIFLSYRDTLEIFAAKCAGLMRLRERHSYLQE